MSTPIYIERFIDCPIERLWQLTQSPELHERWDLRFSSITYLPNVSDDAPQRFRYTTRIGFGLAISGEGETAGERDGPGGQRTSALKFWSDSPISLIRSGAGYWKYVPIDTGVRFITGYDYEVRFGAAGRLFDRLVFRPVIGWATAWSFDQLRLWAERDQPPGTTFWRILVAVVSRGSVEIPLARRCLRQPARGVA